MKNLARAPSLVLLVLLCLAAVLLGACASQGPQRLRSAQLDYNQLLAHTASEQLLLNLVRLRYYDTPYFLQAASVNVQYEIESSAGIGLSIVSGGDDTASPGVELSILEQPEITWTPLQGDKFVSQVMRPIPVETIVVLTQSGWSIERVLRTTVQEIGGLTNVPRASGPTPRDLTDVDELDAFSALVEDLRTLQKRQGLAVSLEPGTGASPPGDGSAPAGATEGTYRLLLLDREPGRDAEARSELLEARRRVLEALGIPSGSEADGAEDGPKEDGPKDGAPPRSIPFTVERQNAPPGSVFVAPRSLLGVMYYLSQGVQAPEEHLDRGWASRTCTLPLDDGEPCPPEAVLDWNETILDQLFAVRSSPEPPGDEAFVSVFYLGHWYWIAHADVESKSTFTLLSQLFALQAGGGETIRPVQLIGGD